MRIPLTCLIAAGLLSSHLAFAESCARPVDRSAFDVAGLKSQLMVTALTCSADEKYNAFVTRFRSDLVTQDKALNGYFSRAYGRRGTAQHDDYITNLANSQSQTGLKQGTAFCDQNLSVFDEIAALRSGAELPDYAAGKALAQPVSLDSCGGPVEPPSRTRRVSHKK